MPAGAGFISLVSRHTLRQLKFVVPGGAITYWLNTTQRFWDVIYGASKGWGRCVVVIIGVALPFTFYSVCSTIALASLASGLLTVLLFLYILLMPLIKGVQPNVRYDLLQSLFLPTHTEPSVVPAVARNRRALFSYTGVYCKLLV
jgi:hypothetical protein